MVLKDRVRIPQPKRFQTIFSIDIREPFDYISAMFTEKDIARFRSETAGVKNVIHLNNAGSSLPPDVVRESVLDYLQEEMTFGGYEVHAKYFDEIEGVYGVIARLINASADEIAVLENATVAWSAAFQAIPFQAGDEIICCQADYSSNYLAYLHLQKKLDVKVKLAPNDQFDQVDVAALEGLINKATKLISIVHVPTNSGLVSPVEAIGEIARKHGVLYLLDACQSAGQIPLDVEQIGCDLLSATGRKYLRGPRGTGFLYVNSKVKDQLVPAAIDLHSAEWTATNEYRFREDARKFENWESNFAGILGLKKAVEYALEAGVDDIWERVQQLGTLLRQKLNTLEKVTIHDVGEVMGGIVSFSVEGYQPEQVKSHLASHGINISWLGTPNARLDMETRGIDKIARASVHYFNTESELDALVSKLALL